MLELVREVFGQWFCRQCFRRCLHATETVGMKVTSPKGNGSRYALAYAKRYPLGLVLSQLLIDG